VRLTIDAVRNETFGFQPEGLGQHSPGQRPGKTIGTIICTLKGCDSLLVVPALQAGLSNLHKTQGVALGYVIPALQAEDQDGSLAKPTRLIPCRAEYSDRRGADRLILAWPASEDCDNREVEADLSPASPRISVHPGV
jgi:hypothetical protein